MAANGNMYAFARQRVMEEQASRVSGNPEGLLLVVFTKPLEEVARDALEKSFQALGFDAHAGAYANIAGLSPADTFDIVEGIDPIALVAADAEAATLCSQAVRKPFPPLHKMRLFGREARAFPNLNGMFATDADKQAVWRLLKTLR